MRGTSAFPGSTSHQTALRICFVFASRAIGGAEKSMLRMMRYAHPAPLDCRVVVCRSGSAPLVEEVRQLGIPVKQLGTLAAASLTAAFREFVPDLAYFFGNVRTILWALAARRAGIRACLGAERGSGDRWINRWSRCLDGRLLQGFITNSQRAASVMACQIGISEDRIAVVYNGVDAPDQEPPQPPAGFPWGHPSMICVANLRPNKGQLVLLRAIRLLRAEYPSIRAILVGRDMTAGRFLERAREEGLGGTFTWTGYIPEVRGFLRRADVFVLPTLFREGMPTALLEAMREGLPVIGTEVGGVTELIQDGQNGLVVEPNCPDRLAEAIGKVLASPAWGKRLGKAGQEFVLRHCTMERMINGHMTAFRRFLQESARDHPR